MHDIFWDIPAECLGTCNDEDRQNPRSSLLSLDVWRGTVDPVNENENDIGIDIGYDIGFDIEDAPIRPSLPPRSYCTDIEVKTSISNNTLQYRDLIRNFDPLYHPYIEVFLRDWVLYLSAMSGYNDIENLLISYMIFPNCCVACYFCWQHIMARPGYGVLYCRRTVQISSYRYASYLVMIQMVSVSACHWWYASSVSVVAEAKPAGPGATDWLCGAAGVTCQQT
jgi:hypothetical protein